MTQTTNYFPNIVGQEDALRKLAFYIQGYEKTKVFPNVCLTGTRGFGKTTIAEHIGRNLTSSENPDSIKRFVAISGAEFAGNKALKTFIESVVINYIQNQECTLFFDEIHLAHDSVKNWLLHVLNPTESNITRNSYEDQEYEFDFKRFTFLSASTNIEKISLPLQSRIERVELRPYKPTELITLLKRYAKDVKFLESVEEEIVKTMRGSPREIVMFAKRKLPNYLANRGDNVKSFNRADWQSISKSLSIKPLGLLPNEIEALKYLKLRGGATLTSVAAYLGLDAQTVRRDCELFLLAHNLIRIDGKRYITPEGQKVLDECNKIG